MDKPSSGLKSAASARNNSFAPKRVRSFELSKGSDCRQAAPLFFLCSHYEKSQLGLDDWPSLIWLLRWMRAAQGTLLELTRANPSVIFPQDRFYVPMLFHGVERLSGCHGLAWRRTRDDRNCLTGKKKPAEAGFFWCGREDSNFHGLPHSDLNAARLPIPPRPHRGRADLRRRGSI
jgi:hypothetical protein